jgi:hypothetical protein
VTTATVKAEDFRGGFGFGRGFGHFNGVVPTPCQNDVPKENNPNCG